MRALGLLMLALHSICPGQTVDSSGGLRLLAFGDTNLGRTVGQRLLKGDIDYPFEKIQRQFAEGDVVFLNLESQLSDQNGITEDPRSNVIFCGPPVAAAALRRAGVGVVSTANNHAFDYGMKGLVETISFLRSEGIAQVGTSTDSISSFAPAVVEKKGIRLGFVAYTQFVNLKGGWFGHISVFDTQRCRIEIEDLRKKTDFVIASYHGGSEYSDSTDAGTLRDMRMLVDWGSDVVLGHHPHVPLGIIQYKQGVIFSSLGNFVFYQTPYWTRRAFGVDIEFLKTDSLMKVGRISLLPIRAGYQPSADLDDGEVRRLMKRIKSFSNVDIVQDGKAYVVQLLPLATRQ